MSDNVVIAIVAAVSAIFGGLLTSVFAPLIKDRLDRRTAELARKRALIEEWRKMLLQVDEAAKSTGNVGRQLQTHAKFPSLEPHLTEAGRKVVYAANRTVIGGSALAHPTRVLLEEVARIEKQWELTK